jgi:hypothetical protein
MVIGYVVIITKDSFMMPKITDKPSEPDFFAPTTDWREFLRTLTRKECIEFHASLEVIIQIMYGAELESIARDLRV